MVSGMGLKYELPGPFHTSKLTYSKFEKNGSGVISAMLLDGADVGKSKALASLEKKPTSLTVDFGRKSGADLLVAQVGPMVGFQVGYWMQFDPAKLAEKKGVDGYFTKTTQFKLGDQKAVVMTLQKGDAPEVKYEGNKITVGGQELVFDGEKLILGK